MGSVLAASDFDPNGNYFASAVTALDTHKIRVQSTNTSSTLANAFSLDKGHKLTSISWGVFSTVNTSKQQRKKRRQSNGFSIENQFLAVGLNKGSILIYSPLTNEVIAKLENPNASSINDFHYSSLTNSGWSVDVGQNVVEWDLVSYKPKRQFNIQEPINVIRVIEYDNKPHLLVASHSVLLVDIETQETIKTFPGHISPIHTLTPITLDSFITAAESDRYINIYPLDGVPTVLVAQSNVLSVSYGNNTVTAVTEDGIVEVFTDPFAKAATTSKRKGQQSKQANGRIELKRPNATSLLKIENSFINQNNIIITWLEDASIPYFEKIEISSISDVTTITKDRPAIQAKDHSLFGQDVAAPKQYNESNAVVTSGDNLRFLDNKERQEDETLASDDEGEDGPTLAEKLEALKVQQPVPKKKQGRATAGSLAVVLTQALRANDHALLETVLSNRDETVLKNTIQRLDTSLAVVLLERLAERIARQTHRQGQLNIWVKWVMAIHGGYLVNIPNLAKSLSSLQSTLNRRAATLPRLLEIQGRLDVLYSQQEMRLVNNEQAEDEYNESEESDVEYIEELEDANLIDDGEQDFYEEDEEGFMSVDESSDEEAPIADKLSDGEIEDEENYSDVEVNGNGEIEEDSESEDEQEALKKRIAKLRAKQRKH